MKNPVEIENLKKVHVKDGVAMVKFQMWLEEKMAAGEAVTEVDVDEKLMALRGEQALNIGVQLRHHRRLRRQRRHDALPRHPR